MHRFIYVGSMLLAAIGSTWSYMPTSFAEDADYGRPPAGALPEAPRLPEAPGLDAEFARVPLPPPPPLLARLDDEAPAPVETPAVEAPQPDSGAAAAPAAEEELGGFPPPAPCSPRNPRSVCPPPTCSPCAIDDCNPCVPPSAPRLCRWRIMLEGSISRVGSPEGPFGLRAFTGSQMSWDPIDLEPAFGGRVTVQRALSPLSYVELRGEYTPEWSDSARTSGSFAFSPAIPGIAPTNSATMSTDAEFISGELNYWRRTAPCGKSHWSYGGGIRVISFNETARADDFGTAFGGGFAGAPFVESESDNLFIGLQAGGAYHMQFSRCLSGSLGAKLLLGTMRHSLEVRDQSIFSGGPHGPSTEDDDSLAFGAELTAELTWRLSRRFALTTSYRVLVMEDVVRAHDAMDFTKAFSGAVQAQAVTDDLYVHSLYFGIVLDL